MRNLYVALYLCLAASAQSASAQATQKQSKEHFSEYVFPCAAYCENADAKRLQWAMGSADTRPHQKAKMTDIIRLYTTTSGTDWAAAAKSYFDWRAKDETQILSVALKSVAAAPPPNSAAAPRLMNGNSLLWASDYPAGSMARGEEGTAEYQVTIKNGRPATCNIISSSGYRELDDATCRLVMERAVFDTSNVPKGAWPGAWPIFKSRIRWTIQPNAPRPYFTTLTAAQSVSRVDPNKMRCQYSDGQVSFVIAGIPCIEGAPLQKPSMAYANAKPVVENAIERPDFDGSLKAARAGDKSQFLPLASMYMTGTVVEKDAAKALFWIQKAESAGLAEAKLTLALLHAEGGIIEKNPQKAYDYLNAFVTAGNTSPRTAEITEKIKSTVGENAYSCMAYGFRLGTPNYSQCLMQTEQSQQIARQQAQLAQQQAQFAQQQAQYAEQQYQLQIQQYQRQLAAEQEAREREEKAERQAASERLRQMSEDMLCPKKTKGGIFAEPVAGCGRNKNEPRTQPLTQIQICRAAHPRNPEACH